MILIVGLGNPGEKYKNTRHNIGFMVLEKFAEKNNFPDFKFSKKFNALISEDIFNNDKLLLLKSRSFMNESGKSVKKLISNTNYSISNLWVVHDDLDLGIGQIKIVKNRGPAGHNGIKSIIENLGTKDFVRFRVGINQDTENREQKTEKYVLDKFSNKEKEILKEIIEKTAEAIKAGSKEGIEKAMNEFNV